MRALGDSEQVCEKREPSPTIPYPLSPIAFSLTTYIVLNV